MLLLVPSGDRQHQLNASSFYLFIYLKLKSDSSHDVMQVSFLGSSRFLEQAYRSHSRANICPRQYCRNYTRRCFTYLMHKYKQTSQ